MAFLSFKSLLFVVFLAIIGVGSFKFNEAPTEGFSQESIGSIKESESFLDVSICLGNLCAEYLPSPSDSIMASNLSDKYDISPWKAYSLVQTASWIEQVSGVSRYLILAIAGVESDFRTRVISSTGAIGLMQIIPYWHKDKIAVVGDGPDVLHNPSTNMLVGAMVFAEYFALSKNNAIKALHRYRGATTAYPKLVMKEKQEIKALNWQASI